MRVVKKAVIGGVVAVALAVSLYFALVWAQCKKHKYDSGDGCFGSAGVDRIKINYAHCLKKL